MEPRMDRRPHAAFEELETYIEWAYEYMDRTIHETAAQITDETTVDVHAQLTGGKRFRPMVTMLCCQAYGGKPEDALPYMIPMELMHTGSLAHDDVLDKDDTRRGAPSLPAAAGIGQAILVGDALFGRAIEDLSFLHPRVIGKAGRTVGALARGALREVRQRDLFKEPPILEIINLKTASLFSLASVSGGLAAGCSKAEENVLHDYGFSLGVSFQMADDLADLLESLKKGEAVGDLRLRQISYPLFCLYISGPKLKAAVESWSAGQLGLDALMELVQEDNAGLLRAKKKIAEFHGKAIDAALAMPDTKYRPLLKLLPKFTELKMIQEVGALEEYLELDITK